MTTGQRAIVLTIAACLLSAGCATHDAVVASPEPAGTPAVGPEGARAPAAAGERTVARYAGGAITAGELEARAAGPLLAPRQRVFEVESAILEGMVFDRLVVEAARQAELTVDEYLGAEIDAGVRQPTDEQVADVLTEYRAQLPPDDGEARAQVVSFLLRQERKARLDSLRHRLFAAAEVEIHLDPPRVLPPLRPFNPVHGGAEAAVTIVEFSDFQCPYCRGVQPVLDELLSRYPGALRIVFKQLPLPSHPEARLAAVASLCAADQRRFWPFHRLLFERRDGFGSEELLALAAGSGLDPGAFSACVADPAKQAQIDADVSDAAALGIDGTPRFLINGRIVEGAQPLEAFVAIVDDELRRAARLADGR